MAIGGNDRRHFDRARRGWKASGFMGKSDRDQMTGYREWLTAMRGHSGQVEGDRQPGVLVLPGGERRPVREIRMAGVGGFRCLGVEPDGIGKGDKCWHGHETFAFFRSSTISAITYIHWPWAALPR